MLSGVVGCVKDGVSERTFSVDGGLPFGGGPLNRYVQIV